MKPVTTVNDLAKRLEEASQVYYNTGKMVMTDAEFDSLVVLLRELDPNHPFLAQVGSLPTGILTTVNHQIPMGSLDKSTVEEFPSWHKKMKGPFCASYKMDGSSIEIIYKKGRLVQAITRGDGIVGEDVTQNVKRFKNVPLKMKDEFTGSVRGEAILHTEEFQKYFQGAANPRNAANGTVRRKDGTGSEYLRFYAFDAANGKEFETHVSKLEYLKKNFDVVEYFVTTADSPEVILAWFDLTGGVRGTLPFEIDGIVIRINSEKDYYAAGDHNNRPKGATVLKWEAQNAETVLESVELTIGHTGAIVPTGKFKSVPIGGVTVSSALLNNFDYIKGLDLAIGDTVVLERAGDVIPHVSRVVKRPKGRKVIAPPTECPFCGSELVKTGVHVICESDECSGKKMGLLKSWIRKRDIKFIGDSMMSMLYEQGLVTKPQDLYYLTEEELTSLPLGIGIVGDRAKSIVSEIEKSRECPLNEFMGSLGIKFLGRRQAEIMISQGVLSLETFQNITVEELSEFDGFSTTKATGIVKGIAMAQDTIAELLKAGVKIRKMVKEKKVSGGKLKGNSYCFTGGINKLDSKGDRYTRERMWELTRENGGEVHEDVKPNTTYLVQADPTSQSSKTKKAAKMGVQILSEDDFFQSLTK